MYKARGKKLNEMYLSTFYLLGVVAKLGIPVGTWNITPFVVNCAMGKVDPSVGVAQPISTERSTQ